MENTTRPANDRRRLDPLPACLIACLAVGCGGSSLTATPGPTVSPSATAEGGSDPSDPAIVGAKSDRDGVLAALKAKGIDIATTEGLVVKTFGYKGLKEPIEWIVEVEQNPPPQGQQNMIRFSLPPDAREVGDGTLDLVLLPPKSTGREGMQIVLRSATAGGKEGRLVAFDAPALWFGWSDPRARSQSRLDGGPLNPKPGRTYKLIAYSARQDDSPLQVDLTLRCKSVKP